ncbi:MAG: tyrosine-protein phosphatase [bacterium]
MKFRGKILPCFLLSMAMFLFFNRTLFAQNLNKKIHLSTCRKLFDNFHAVESGKLYRSKQLSSKNLNRYIKKLGIKTIVNLRGKNEDKDWWQQEKNITDENNICLFNISMNSNLNPTPKQIKKLLNIYQNAPKPILIHCRSGVDRSGEAAALWVLNQQKKEKTQALKQLSLKYGYLKWFHPAKKQFIKNFKN